MLIFLIRNINNNALFIINNYSKGLIIACQSLVDDVSKGNIPYLLFHIMNKPIRRQNISAICLILISVQDKLHRMPPLTLQESPTVFLPQPTP